MTYFGANAVLPAGSWGLPQVSEWTVRVHVHVHVHACVAPKFYTSECSENQGITSYYREQDLI